MSIGNNSAPLYRYLASAIDAYHRCAATNNVEWRANWEHAIDKTVENVMPSGSGFDSGTHLDIGGSTGEKLVFTTSFRHMDDNGFYDGWTEHTVTILPSLVHGFHVKVSGRNRNDIKDYIAEQFEYLLSRDVPRGSAPVTYSDMFPTEPAQQHATHAHATQDTEPFDGASGDGSVLPR